MERDSGEYDDGEPLRRGGRRRAEQDEAALVPVPVNEAVPAELSKGLATLADQLVASASDKGLALTGNGGLLTALTQQVLQAALEAEMSHHLGYDKHEPIGRNRGNSRNGSSPKRVRTEVGEVDLAVPRDREGTFDPQIVPKHQRRLTGFDDAVISLYAKGMTTGDVVAHLEEVYDTTISRDLVSTVVDKITDEMKRWRTRPLDRVYPVLIIDAIYLKVRDGTVSNRPVYVVMGVNLEGYRDVLGMWVGPTGGEGAKAWMAMLTDLRNRGVMDAFIVCCDGLKGMPEAINTVWPQARIQTCVVHLVRNSLRLSSRKDWQKLTPGMRRIYTAVNREAAELEFEEFAERWEKTYPALIRSWREAWEEFTPFLDFPVEVRKLVYTTNAIESLNARFRAAVRRRGSFPDEDSALKVLYLAVKQREKNKPGPTGRINGWRPILNTLTMAFGEERLGLN
ncbi:IS256 family transposase [Nocardioides sp. NPDC058538]|uniref:IS256 family transposase n=1 Tax=Nocardioides sp. NPDC058538 TaxID=3346542 RepID=UPI0036595D60